MPPPFPMPATVDAVHNAAILVQTAWVAAAEASSLGETQRQRYIAGLISSRSLLHPYQGDALAALVVNVARDASQLEYGTPVVHLPTAIRWGQSKKARRNKQGDPYLIIPFTHGTPGAGTNTRVSSSRVSMPSSVYRVAHRLQPGQRLTAGPSRGQAVQARGLTPHQEGMVRRPARRGRGSSYLTFRTITPASQGWVLPARPGTHLAATVQRETLPQVQAMIEAAVRQDVETIARQRLGG